MFFSLFIYLSCIFKCKFTKVFLYERQKRCFTIEKRGLDKEWDSNLWLQGKKKTQFRRLFPRLSFASLSRRCIFLLRERAAISNEFLSFERYFVKKMLFYCWRRRTSSARLYCSITKTRDSKGSSINDVTHILIFFSVALSP